MAAQGHTHQQGDASCQPQPLLRRRPKPRHRSRRNCPTGSTAPPRSCCRPGGTCGRTGTPTSSTSTTRTCTTRSSSAPTPSRSGSASTSRGGFGTASAAPGASTSASPPSVTVRTSTSPTSCPTPPSCRSVTGPAASRATSTCVSPCRRARFRPIAAGRSTRWGRSSSCAAATATTSAARWPSPVTRLRASTCSYRPDPGPAPYGRGPGFCLGTRREELIVPDGLSSIGGLADKHRRVLDRHHVTDLRGLVQADRRVIYRAMANLRPRPTLELISQWQDEARSMLDEFVTDTSDWHTAASFAVIFGQRHHEGAWERRVEVERTEVEPERNPQVWPGWDCVPVCAWLAGQLTQPEPSSVAG